MARVNIGINPLYLSDQHLIAESVEITMITGGLKKNNCLIKSPIPKEFTLGKGHINFFKDKLSYLKNRLDSVNLELDRRGIKNSTNINLSEYPQQLWNDWVPDMKSSIIIRQRVGERLLYPLKAKSNFHRYYKKPIIQISEFAQAMYYSELYNV